MDHAAAIGPHDGIEGDMRKIFGAAVLAAAAMVLSAGAQASRLDESEIDRIVKANHLDAAHAEALRAALAGARLATQGDPSNTRHPVSRERCEAEVLAAGRLKGGDADEAVCGHPNMAPVPSADGAVHACIDRYKFPDVPCDFPVTWVRAVDAARICEAEGKRLCDAHEWEGACAGAPQPDDWRHGPNASREKVWAYGATRRPEFCAFGEPKSPGCEAAIEANKGVAEKCGPNTWPSGDRWQCAGPLGVYDMHGNAAEHMNLARSPAESGASGGHGVTEMKVSWFVFPDREGPKPHEDDCLWRAPGWHRTAVMDPASHANYHLGFRCCADVR
jgi:hypothetical protein